MKCSSSECFVHTRGRNPDQGEYTEMSDVHFKPFALFPHTRVMAI